jgi:hypothetical protein
METKTGFESHPVSNLYFFESAIPPSQLDGKGILLRFTHNSRSYEGVFEIDAWPHPTLTQFSAMSARAYTYSGLQVTYHAIKFDSSRASKIRRVKHEHYDFEADFGQLEPMQQVPAIYEAVCKEFEKTARRFKVRDQPA